jgi:acid stress-induced BolA-like protein IbaG/YrbA
MAPELIAEKIQQALPSAQVQVQGDDGVHFEAVIIASEFEGLSPIARHRLVYDALGNAMDSAIHALSIKTIAPSEQHT